MSDPAAPDPTAPDPSARVPLSGSHRPSYAVPSGAATDPVDPDEVAEVTLVLRRRAEPSPETFRGRPLTRAELAERYGADPAELEAVTREITEAGASVVSADPATRLVRVRGTVKVLTALFGTSLQRVSGGGLAGSYRIRSGELTLSPSLAGPLVAVLGLDDRPQASARFRTAASAATSGYSPLQIAEAYAFPDGDGSGQTIAIVELGGGFAQSDLDPYFGGLGLTTPSVSAVSVDGGVNKPGADPQGADGEVLLDIEVSGALAPKADQLVYFAPNTDAGFLDAITQAAHASPAPTAISISWGQSEDQWTAQSRTAMDGACADAVLLGATVLAAAGDSGSTDNQTQGAPHVDFPASSPHVLACGGTTLQIGGAGSISSERVWNGGASGGATGGGVSDAFAVPSWQQSVGVPDRSGGGGAGRGVPDVSGDADPQTGYRVRIDGTDTVIGGTSAVAPLWAALVCRLAQAAGTSLGLLQPTLYRAASASAPAPGFRDITQGDNIAYTAGPGWDACTGLGTPDGASLPGVINSGSTP